MIHSIDYLLQDISTNGSVYDEFTPESYLAAEQLNKLTDYFEDSDRLRTTKLHGVGIVCGFQFSINKNEGGQLEEITVTPGVAITTDGDILHTDIKALSSYIPFLNKAVYERLDANDGDVIELRERRAAESPKEDLLPGELPLARLKNSNEYKLVVYLEHYKVDPGLCSATSCNDTGNHVHMDQKFLLVHNDVWKDKLMKKDTIFHEHNVWEFYDDLPNLSVNRAVVKPNSSGSSLQLYNIFRNEVTKIRSTKKLEQAYVKILDRFDPRIDFVRHGITKSAVRNAFRVLFDGLNRNLDIQYRYDAMRELIDTYTEIKSLILHINSDCNPVIDAFPKHISLGPLNNPNHEPCRHRMYYSALHKNKKENLRRFKSVVIRFWQQLRTYSFTPNQAVRITSSRDNESSLGERAVPYYYKYANTHKHWDQNLVLNRIPRQAHSYHRLGSNSQVFYPNQTTHLDKEFYRIEGHLGMPQSRALAEVVKQKTDFGLAFDVKTVSIHANTRDVDWDKYKCHFTDLHAMLNDWQTDFKCLVKGFEQFFGNMTTDGSYLLGTSVKVSEADRKELLKKEDKEKEEAAKNTDMVGDPTIKMKMAGGESIHSLGTEKSITIKEAVRLQQTNNNLDCSLAGKVLASNQTANLAQQQYQLAIMLPTQLYIHALILNYEKSWSTFLTDAAYLEKVKKQIKDFCSDTNNFNQVMTNYIKSLQSKQSGMARQTSASSAVMAIFELINIYNRMKEVCCYVSKLTWLKTEIKRRKEQVLTDLTLKKFVEKHSGLEHAGGVRAGGTFVMVYAGEEEKSNPFGSTSQRVVADFSLPYLCSTDCAPAQVVVLPPAKDPNDGKDYKVLNDGHDICEDHFFELIVDPKPTEDIIFEHETEISGKRIQFDPTKPVRFSDVVEWKGEKRSQGMRILINGEEKYQALIHKSIELDFEVVFKDGAFSFINRTEEECHGEMFIQTETENEKGIAQPFDEKFILQIGVPTRVTIFCQEEICRPSWGVTLDPKETQKVKIDLNFTVEHIDPPLVQIINENKMKLTDKGYTMFVNKKKTTIQLNSNGDLMMDVEKPTQVKFTYDDGKREGVWQQTIQPAQHGKEIVNIAFDPKRLGDGTKYELANGTNIPFTTKGYTLFVGGKRQSLKLNTKGQLILDIKKPTKIRIEFEDATRKGEWERTIGTAVIKKKTPAVLLANSKKSVANLESSIKRKRPSTTTQKSMHKATTNQLAAMKTAMSSPAKMTQLTKRFANPKMFNMLDRIKVAEHKSAQPYVEANMLGYFAMLQPMTDAVYVKAVGSNGAKHHTYFKKHASSFSAGFKKKLNAMEFHSKKAATYAKKFVELM